MQGSYSSFATWNCSVYKNLARCLVYDSLMKAHAKIGPKHLVKDGVGLTDNKMYSCLL